jgi:multidrug efflux pump subunit AcrA (membrane-fusion protein)
MALRRPMVRRLLFVSLAVALLFSGVAAAIAYSRIPRVHFDLERSDAIVADIVRRVSVNGIIVSGDRVNIYAPMSLRTRVVLMAVGQHVRTGEVLARLDSSLLGLELVKREIAVVRAEAALRKVKPGAGGADTVSANATEGTDGSLDIRLRTLELREARLELARVRRVEEACVLVSPIDGEVVSVNVREGEPAPAQGQGPPAFVVAKMEAATIEAEADEFQSAAIRQGQRAFVYVESLLAGQPLIGHVSSAPQLRRAPSVINGPAKFAVAVTLPNRPDGLRNGVSARVEIETGIARGALAVPLSAVFGLDSGDHVIEERVKGGYRLTPVRTGLSDDRFVAIEADLRAGSPVLVGDTSRLREVARELRGAEIVSKGRP